MMNRKAYTHLANAHPSEKAAALENYVNTKAVSRMMAGGSDG
jgi:hypothetical protein